ncbi:MAG: hypothetical protein GY822_26460 [Deltaproteobacteria bacterium]|nr:hypothetical protein [Deltaproteobacteria bacterium]
MLLLAALGCSPTTTPANNCTPGKSQGCVCTNGNDGAQSCVEDGSAFAACVCEATSSDSGTLVVDDAGTTIDAGTPDSQMPGLAIMTKLVGLWSGPTDSFTVVPDLPIMNMDLALVDDRTLFARQDLDDDNALRFSFSIEEHNGIEELVYRNGGFFEGAAHDSRSTIESYDDKLGVYRFCGIERGCDYLDAIFTFDGADALTLEVDVRGQPHILWDATRVADNDSSIPFPVDEQATGATDQPFVGMSSLQIHASWNDAATADAQVLVSLSRSACPLTDPLNCTWTRNFVQPLMGGETNVDINTQQLHAETYYLNVVLDKDANLFPSTGDVLQIPNKEVVVVDDESLHEVNSTISIPVS